MLFSTFKDAWAKFERQKGSILALGNDGTWQSMQIKHEKLIVASKKISQTLSSHNNQVHVWVSCIVSNQSNRMDML